MYSRQGGILKGVRRAEVNKKLGGERENCLEYATRRHLQICVHVQRRWATCKCARPICVSSQQQQYKALAWPRTVDAFPMIEY